MYPNTPYEEYMRNVLGYMPNNMQGNCNCQTEDFYNVMPVNPVIQRRINCNLEEVYPDLYKKVYPLVCKECKMTNDTITKELIEQMTEKIYQTIEIDLKIETKREDMRNTKTPEDRQIGVRNNILRDIIKILIIRELLDGRFPGGPGMPGPGPRPPFPGGPGMPGPGPRPPFPGGPGPIRPREF